MLRVSELFIYPIKSLGGISVTSAMVTDRGLQYDRRWMLVDASGQFMTQRSLAEMALLQTEITPQGLHVGHKQKDTSITIPFTCSEETVMVDVWSDRCRANKTSKEIDQWFSDTLSTTCSLVFMKDTTKRRVDGRYAQNKEITSFSDAYPFLIIGQASLDDLNSRIEEPLPMNRFRPNIVFAGGNAFEEDTWAHFSTGGINFFGVKLCSRCVVTTIDQDNAKKNKEPLKTLATYRSFQNKIYFGQNLLHQGTGTIAIEDSIEVLERKPARFK
jgi:uncharacterized protein YcbX